MVDQVRQTQDIAFGVTGQLVYLDAPEGRPSSVTATVYESGDGDDQDAETAIGAASVESGPNTTTTAAAGASQADPRAIAVTSATGIVVGREYQIRDASGLRERLVVESLSGTSVKARHRLHNDYASGAAFESTRVQATIDATWVADETNLEDDRAELPAYRIRWAYVVGGLTYVADTFFDLVRYPGKTTVTPADVERLHPGWLDRLPTDHRKDQGRALIEEAYRTVAIDMQAAGADEDATSNPEVIDDMVRRKAIELAEFGRYLAGRDDGGRYDAARAAYQARLDSFVRLVDRIGSKDEDGASVKRQAQGVSVR